VQLVDTTVEVPAAQHMVEASAAADTEDMPSEQVEAVAAKASSLVTASGHPTEEHKLLDKAVVAEPIEA
jgi:hypothetical protein